MRKLFNLVVWGLLLATAANEAAAQDAAKELQQISAHYGHYRQFATGFSYLLYADVSRGKLIEKQEGMLMQSGGNTYMRALNTETLRTTKVNITVNHDRKIMLVSKADPKPEQNEALMLAGIDSLLQAKGKLKLRQLSKHANVITIVYDRGEVKASSVTYDPETYLVSEIDLLFSDQHGVEDLEKDKQPLLVIRYNHTRVNGEIDERYFREDKFIRHVNDKVVPVQTYHHYKFICQ